MRTPLLSSLRRALQIALRIHKSTAIMPFAEHIELLQAERQEQLAQQAREKLQRLAAPSNDYSRRQFLGHTAKAIIAAGVGSLLPIGCSTVKTGQTAPRIAVIGAGIAGLNTAYQLQKAGYRADIFEASKRSGGRIFSGQNMMGEGLTTEIGGEFIDTWHTDMLDLAQEFKLPLFDVAADVSTAKINQDMFMFNGIKYSEAQIVAELLPIAAKLQDHASQLPDIINYQTLGKAKAFDSISIDEYFAKIGIKGWLQTLFDVAYTGEYGLPIGEQSALNFLTFFDPDTSDNKFKLFGESDERYKIKGGNQQITDQLTTRVGKQIRYEHALTAIRSNGAGGFKLNFANGKEATADVLVLAIPFSVLRHIDLQLEIPDIKRRVIQNLGYGTNSKLFIGTTKRLWREQGQAGFLYSNQIHTSWDSSQGQNNNSGAGSYTVFLGGQPGYDLDKSRVDSFNPSLDLAFSGFSQALNGKTELFNWAKYPHTQGSYSCYRIGQWTSIAGTEALPVGNLLFAGEHCSLVSAGFMNGGAESGRVAAGQIIAKLRGTV